MLLLLLCATILIELIAYIPAIWGFRLFFATLLATFVPGLAAIVLITEPSVLSGAILLLSLTRVFNYLRIAKARMHPEYMYTATRRTSFWLTGTQFALLALFYVKPHALDPNNRIFIQVIAILQLLAAAILLYSTLRNLNKARYTHDTTYLSDKELPTVTVAIPARNETTDLEECLRTVLASDYPKLEVIVLDDCSQLNTSEIIKSFAHDGVRFIKGVEPDEHWLAKNKAYDALAKAASGELILFCGVDVRFGQSAIRALVTSLKVRNKRMISVMPRRLDESLTTAFIQPMRYWWEIALPRRMFNRPPVLSTVWLIERKSLTKLGGLAAVMRQIIPEAFFARELVKQDDSYSFMRASNDLDIQTAKIIDEQWATALRIRYPQIHHRPEIAFLLILLDSVVAFAPVPIAIWALIVGEPLALVASLAAAVLLIITHVSIIQCTNPPNTWLGFINFPVCVLLEIIIGTSSMIRYEFGTVEWKDRNVCIPVMHAYKHLPKA